MAFVGAGAQEVQLAPAPGDAFGEWAQAFLPLRMRATPAQDVRFEGPTLVFSQWAEIVLGTARYAFLIGAQADAEASLWVDGNRDKRITPAEVVVAARAPGIVTWQFDLSSTPTGGEAFPYPVTVLWPVGRGYVYLMGGAPRRGEFEVAGRRAAFVLVDGDLNGTFGTRDDFYAVDVDGDGIVHGEPDGHERFALGEPFTVGGASLRISQVSPGGASVRLAPTAYVAPKPPLIPGHPAPELRFSTFPDGKPFALSDLRGQVVLVKFWATWCDPCLNELPQLLDLYAQHRGQGFEIVGLSLDTSERDLRAVLSSAGIGWPVAFEGKSWDNTLAQLFRVYQIPTSYLLDREGIIRFRDLHGDELASRVAELLAPPRAEAPVEAPVVAPVVGPPRPILEIAAPAEVGIAIGETSSFPVTLTNTSPYDAEEVVLTVLGLPPEVAPPVQVGTVPAFGERVATLAVKPGAGAVPAGPIEVVYHYCIGDLCFQIEDRAAVTFALGEARPRAAAIPAWWLLVFIGVGLVIAMFLRGRALAAIGLALVGLSAASLVVGVLRGQATQAWRIASVLCTACVGIEEVRTETPTLASVERDAIAAFAGSADLVVFHTPWCKSCPYVKALVAEMARINPRIRYELVDADQDRPRAERSGIVPSGRVIVPAIVVAQTGRVLFGTSDLTARILAALGEVR
jgi:thiol-disulfide isomerase/thioredoxin